MTARTVRTRWNHRPEPAPEPVDPRITKAKNLPMFGPGLVITVPLHLLKEYMDIYQLEPNGIREPKVQPRSGPGEAILLVKRVPKPKEGE